MLTGPVSDMIPPASSEVHNADSEHWNLVNHNVLYGMLEDALRDALKSDSPRPLHRFVIVVDVRQHGSRLREISLAEAVISVFDLGNWVADINMFKTLESGFLVRIPGMP
jgi:hypothetical protein